MKNVTITIISGVLIALTPLKSQAAETARPAASSVLAAPIAGVSVLQAEGIVQAVDHAARTVTVKDAAAGLATFNVSDDPAKLAELRPGDKVRVRMVRDAVVTLVSVGVTGTKAGKTSADDAAAQNDIAADIVTVDQKTGVLALKGPKGNVFHIQASDRLQLAHLSAGMHVEVAYAARATVSVSAAQ